MSTRASPTAMADRKVLLVRLGPDTMRRFKHLAVDRDCTLQALAAEAIDLLFEHYEGRSRHYRGRPPENRACTSLSGAGEVQPVPAAPGESPTWAPISDP